MREGPEKQGKERTCGLGRAGAKKYASASFGSRLGLGRGGRSESSYERIRQDEGVAINSLEGGGVR